MYIFIAHKRIFDKIMKTLLQYIIKLILYEIKS